MPLKQAGAKIPQKFLKILTAFRARILNSRQPKLFEP